MSKIEVKVPDLEIGEDCNEVIFAQLLSTTLAQMAIRQKYCVYLDKLPVGVEDAEVFLSKMKISQKMIKESLQLAMIKAFVTSVNVEEGIENFSCDNIDPATIKNDPHVIDRLRDGYIDFLVKSLKELGDPPEKIVAHLSGMGIKRERVLASLEDNNFKI
jgi:hypothetical protein